MSLKPWKTLHSRYLVNDRWLKLRADSCETSSGVIIDPYYIQESGDWVQIVAFDEQDRILITRQYRHGDGSICDELPCGIVEAGEAPITAATRELLEETGCVSETLLPLPVLSPNPARYTNRIHGFIARGVRQTQPQLLDEREEIEFEFRTVDDVLSMIGAGSFRQALHVAALLLALKLHNIR